METLPSLVVTGAAGWLGTAILHHLYAPQCARTLEQPRPRVRCLIQPGEQLRIDKEIARALDVEVVTGDVRSPEACDALFRGQRGATLIHCAGIIHPRRVADFYSINVEGARTLLRAATQAGVQRAVMVSSNSPCGCNPRPDHVFDEATPYAPYMHYGRSKMQMEQLTREVHTAGDIATVIIRAPWFYGPYQPPRQTLFFSMIRDGKAPIVGSGNNMRSMAYVDNLAQGVLRAAVVPQAAGETYWIADEKPYTMNQVIDTVEALLENEFRIPVAHKRLRLPRLASTVAYGVDWATQGLGFYAQKVHVLSEMDKTIACSVEKAKRELGYRPDVSLEEGMRRSLGWCFEQRLLQAA